MKGQKLNLTIESNWFSCDLKGINEKKALAFVKRIRAQHNEKVAKEYNLMAKGLISKLKKSRRFNKEFKMEAQKNQLTVKYERV